MYVVITRVAAQVFIRKKRRGYWVAYIDFQKHRYSLGVYSDKEDAIHARKEAERRLHDPKIKENLDLLTEESKKKFLCYLKGKQ